MSHDRSKARGLGRLFEKKIAKARGGLAVKRSGGILGLPGDVRTDLFLSECKATANKSLSIKREWLQRIEGEALRQGKLPTLEVNISGNEWTAVPRWVFERLTAINVFS